jgi:hypothetical protein
MSCYIKLNSWAGDDVNGPAARLAKMFGMDSGEANQAMRKIIAGQNWQFQRPISQEQAKTARSYLRWLGFDPELSPTKPSFRLNNHSDSICVSRIPFSKMGEPSPLIQLVDLTGNISNAFTLTLFKVNPDEKTLSLRHYVSLSSNFNPKAKIKFGEGPLGQVARSKQPFLDENIMQNQAKLGFYKKEEDLKSFLAIPVVYKKLEGVLAIDSKQSYSFPVKQQKIITGLADQMAWHLDREKRNLEN